MGGHMRRLVVGATALSLVGASLLLIPATSSAAATCHPFQTPGAYDNSTPTDEDVVGFAFGDQEVSVRQANNYLAAVDASSDRVVTGTAATSVGGRAINFAIVGAPENVTPTALTEIRRSAAALRDPRLPAGQAADLAASTPAILWVSGNVHGNEESGADASLKVLYELAARSDCVASRILANSIVVILPIQNPDGRQAETRRNLYGFDMNRDWFARTQPETDGKLELIGKYPPMLFVDAHEFGSDNYLFPPTADPEYHETPDVAHDWIFDAYSPAIASEFDRQGLKYFHGEPYDFFATIFGDTVPTLGYHAAGMTFEKANGDPIDERTNEQFIAMWASVFEGATGAEQRVSDWHDSFVEAYQQGLAGSLEPNAVFEPKHEVFQQVPDITVRHYFLRDDPARRPELNTLIRRLQRMDVDVYRLTAPLQVDDYHPYADPGRSTRLPAGTIWVPMAQGQKHWIQSMLHEDSYIPYEVTYDVTAWSNPLLMNVRGGWSGNELSPSASLVQPVATPPPPAFPANGPRVGLFEIPNSTRGFEAAGQTRYLFDRVWQLPYENVTTGRILRGLRNIDVLVVPDGYTNYALQALGSKGKAALRDWINNGGRYIGWQGGLQVATRIGASTAKFSSSHTNSPGTLIRATVDRTSPLAIGVGRSVWVMYSDDNTIASPHSVATFPEASSPRFATAGLAEGVETLGGSTVVFEEGVGSGSVVGFSIDPNFRAWTLGTQRILWNAIVEPASTAKSARVGSASRVVAEQRAVSASQSLPADGSAIRIGIATSDTEQTRAVIGRYSSAVEALRIDADTTLLLVANPKAWSAEEHPYLRDLIDDLKESGVGLQWISLV